MIKALLDVRDLRKSFGGLVATDGLNLQVQPHEIHALIGPNGAGKTTLVAQLAGQLAPDGGSVHFNGADITRLPAHQRAQHGLVRSFQITRLFKSLTVLENMLVAVQAVHAVQPVRAVHAVEAVKAAEPGRGRDAATPTLWRRFSAWRPVHADAALLQRAHECLQPIGLTAKHDWLVDRLAHGEQRALEVGMTLATRPLLVLLDEPLAGMSAQESQAMSALVATLRQHCAVLLIEHDVQAVFALADRVSVLVGGRIIATGAPASVRQNAEVIAAYLGEAD